MHVPVVAASVHVALCRHHHVAFILLYYTILSFLPFNIYYPSHPPYYILLSAISLYPSHTLLTTLTRQHYMHACYITYSKYRTFSTVPSVLTTSSSCHNRNSQCFFFSHSFLIAHPLHVLYNIVLCPTSSVISSTPNLDSCSPLFHPSAPWLSNTLQSNTFCTYHIYLDPHPLLNNYHNHLTHIYTSPPGHSFPRLCHSLHSHNLHLSNHPSPYTTTPLFTYIFISSPHI